MRFSLTAVTLGLVSIVAAAPQRPSSYGPPQPQKVTCLTSDTASALVNGFASLLTDYSNQTANTLLASDFTDTSDSINIMAGFPLNSTTFASKTAFMAGQGSQPPIGFTLLGIDAVDCTKVAFRWSAFPNLRNPAAKVKGINSFVASNLNGTAQGWQIKTMYTEYNSCEWIIAYGGTCALPAH